MIQTFREYGLLFEIEEFFKDEQSSGWNLQKSEIRSVCDLSRLCFILALATLYITAQGVIIVEQGKCRWVDIHWFRGNSYFRFNNDPQPAVALRRQYGKHLYRLEFRVFTIHCEPD